MIQLDCILMQVSFYFGNHPKGLYCFVILKILFFSLVEAKSEGIKKETRYVDEGPATPDY